MATEDELTHANRPFAAPEGTYPRDQWPLDVLRTDATGEVDLEQIEHNLSLTPTERILQNDQWAEFVQAVREAGRRARGEQG